MSSASSSSASLTTAGSGSSTTLADFPTSFTVKELGLAALAVHNVLEPWYIEHVFLGGYMALVTGHDRAVDSVDVECRKKLFIGLDKVAVLFEDHPDFEIVPKVRPNTLRIVYLPMNVPVNLMMRGLHDLMIPGDLQHLTIGGSRLPFLSYTNFVVEKIRASAERWHAADAEDLIYMCRYRSMDWEPKVVRGRVKKAVVRKAAERHRCLAPQFQSMGF
ncbi:hypothetical protein EXIGLDRAFT_718444, partial [Exidia glandulosa HHB12029]